MADTGPVALASRLPAEILLQLFDHIYHCGPETHETPDSSLFDPPSTRHAPAIRRSTPSARLYPLLSVCRAWTRIALEVLYREPIVDLHVCGLLAQTLSFGDGEVGGALGQQQSLPSPPVVVVASQRPGAAADWSTADAPKPWAAPISHHPTTTLSQQAPSPYSGMDWYWDPAGGCAQCRQIKRTEQQHQLSLSIPLSIPPSSPRPSTSHSLSTTHASSCQRPLAIDYKRWIKLPCRVISTRHVEKQDLVQLWDLQRVLAYASQTRLEDWSMSPRKTKKRMMLQSRASDGTGHGDDATTTTTVTPPVRPLPVLMVLETAQWFRETTSHVLKNVVGLGMGQLHYQYSQPTQLTDLVREQAQTVQALHLGQVQLTLDEAVAVAQILGQAQGRLPFGPCDPVNVATKPGHISSNKNNSSSVGGQDNGASIPRGQRKHARETRPRLRSLCFSDGCRMAQPRAVLEAFARHCGAGLERVEWQGRAATRGRGWRTVAALQPYPIPTEFSLPVLAKSTLYELGNHHPSGMMGVASSILEKSRRAPLDLVPQEDQVFLRDYQSSQLVSNGQPEEGQALSDHAEDEEARFGEAMIQLGQHAPQVTHLRLLGVEGLWDGCLDGFRAPNQAETSSFCELKKRPTGLARSDSAYGSLSPDMSTSLPPIFPSGLNTSSGPELFQQVGNHGSIEKEDDDEENVTNRHLARRGVVHPSRRCGLQELVLTQCGRGSWLSIPGLVRVCGSDLETLVVDRESCWRLGQNEEAMAWGATTGDRILGGLLAQERQQERMSKLKHLVLLDHWVSAAMVRRALETWSYHLRVLQFLVMPCSLEALLEALRPGCKDPRLEVLMLSVVEEGNEKQFWLLEPEQVRQLLSTVFERFPQLRVVRVNHVDATWTRSEWERFCSL